MGLSQPNIKRLEEKRNIKGLVKALDFKWHWVREEAAAALYRLRDECGFEVWAYALGNDCDEVKRYAMTALSEMGDARALGLLMETLRKGRNGVDAGRAIGMMGDPRAIEPMVKELSNEDHFIRWGAAIALEKLGWRPEDHNETSANYWIALERWDECVNLGEAALLPLIGLFKEKGNISRQIAIAKALGKIGDPRAVEPLVHRLVDRDNEDREEPKMDAGYRIIMRESREELRKQIIHALGTIGHDDGSVGTILNLLMSSDPSHKHYANQVLEKIDWDPHKWTDQNVQYSFSYWLYRSNYSEISAIGRPSIDLLIDVLNRSKPAYLERDEFNRVAVITQTLHVLLDEHNAWSSCNRLQVTALERIVSELSGPVLRERKIVAAFLVGLYKNGNNVMSDRLRNAALASKGRIMEPHNDHFDVSGSCAHHEDSGIGLDFPL